MCVCSTRALACLRGYAKKKTHSAFREVGWLFYGCHQVRLFPCRSSGQTAQQAASCQEFFTLKEAKQKKSMCVCLTLKRQINRQIGGNKGDGSVGGGEQLLHVALFGRRCQPWVSLNQSPARHSAGVKNLVKGEHKNWEITSAASELRGK